MSRLVYENLRTVAIGATYTVLSTPLQHQSSIVKLVNRSTDDVFISTDGVNDMDIAPANSFWLYDETSNSPHEDNIYGAKGTQYYVKGAGSGNVYLVVKYNKVIQQT